MSDADRGDAEAMQPRAEELSGEERELLDHYTELFEVLLEAGEIELGDEDSVLDGADRIIALWRTMPENERPEGEHVVQAVGVVFGECLMRVFPSLSWKRITDSYGSSIGLVSDEPEMFIAPIDAIVKRFDNEPDGFVAELFPHFCVTLEERGLKSSIPNE
ncbi:MAG: DUF3806 domain-containing protein [Phycisphaerae bacterium]|nr:DUF3806 domain-containing protein [Phycisphaerae bacterium]